MNILYIIGNGFDKAQGLATLYKEFYKDYWLPMKPESELEQKVLASIKGDYYNTWADLEEGLGKYSADWQDENTFRSILALFNKRLKDYLVIQDNKLDKKELSYSKLCQDLCEPELYLEPSGHAIYEQMVYGNSAIVSVNIVSLNYTHTFERALGVIKRGDLLNSVSRNNYYYGGILHLHGILDDMILVGVNDESQIANEAFRASDFLRSCFIKPEINEGCMNTRNAEFARMIKDASIIVLYGVSVGPTDNIWWQAIGSRMSGANPPLLLYFPYDPTKDTVSTPNFKRIWSDQFISFLRDKMHIQQSVDILRKRILIGINKDFLKLIE